MSNRDGVSKNIEIQFVRLLSIGLVILCHIQAVMYGRDDHRYSRIFAFVDPEVGVDIFFVISGYLMGQTFLARTDAQDRGDAVRLTWRFWRRRFLRLFPASLFWITFTVVVGLYSRRPGIWPEPVELIHLWSASVFALRNFANAANPSSLGYYWSLSIENQFYFLLPLFWFGLPRMWFWRVVGGLIALSFVYRPGGENWKFLRFDGLLWGLVLYRCLNMDLVQNVLKDLRPPSRLFAWCVLSAVLFAMSGLLVAVGPWFTLIAYGVDCIVASVIVGLATLNRGFIPPPPAPMGRALANHGGDLAYSIYLCHLPVWLTIRDIARGLGFDYVGWEVMVPIGLAAVIATAFASHALLEAPFYRPRPAQTRPVGALVA